MYIYSLKLIFCRISGGGNCLFSAVSVALVEIESLAYDLRILTAIEINQNVSYYANHAHFDKVASELKTSCANNLFCQALSEMDARSLLSQNAE